MPAAQSGEFAARTAQIPKDQLVNWSSSGARRRGKPVAACKACQVAKVKCDGKSQCRRCVTRGLLCEHPGATTLTGKSGLSSRTTTFAASPVSNDGSLMEISGDFADDDTPTTLPTIFALTSASPSNVSSNSTPPREHLQPGCKCRSDFLILRPNLTAARDARRLDEIFEALARLLAGCRALMQCSSCELACSDLITIMTAVADTEPALNAILESSAAAEPVTVMFGDYQMASSFDRMRAVLVLDLVEQTEALLTETGARGQLILNATLEKDPSSCTQAIGRANILFLETSITEMRAAMRRARASLNLAAQE